MAAFSCSALLGAGAAPGVAACASMRSVGPTRPRSPPGVPAAAGAWLAANTASPQQLVSSDEARRSEPASCPASRIAITLPNCSDPPRRRNARLIADPNALHQRANWPFAGPRLVGHQDRQLGLGQDVAGRPAEDHLAQPALGVGALDQQVRPSEVPRRASPRPSRADRSPARRASRRRCRGGGGCAPARPPTGPAPCPSARDSTTTRSAWRRNGIEKATVRADLRAAVPGDHTCLAQR